MYPEAEPSAAVLLPLLPFQKEFLHWAQAQEASLAKARAAAAAAARASERWGSHASGAVGARAQGGILADEMGMGKTIQSIALICTSPAGAIAGGSGSRDAAPPPLGPSGLPIGQPIKATLVVCPVVAVIQWRDEIARYVAPGALKVLLYHGPKRKMNPAELARTRPRTHPSLARRRRGGRGERAVLRGGRRRRRTW